MNLCLFPFLLWTRSDGTLQRGAQAGLSGTVTLAFTSLGVSGPSWDMGEMTRLMANLAGTDCSSFPWRAGGSLLLFARLWGGACGWAVGAGCWGCVWGPCCWRSREPAAGGISGPGCWVSWVPAVGGMWVPAAGVSGVPTAEASCLGAGFWGILGCLLLGCLRCRLPPASRWALGTHCIRAFPSPTVHLWGTEEVAAWLEHLSLCEYKDIFTRHDIRGSELLHLERRDLKVLPHCLLGTRPGLPCTPFSVPSL